MTTPPEPAPDTAQPLAERVGKIETEQERQGGLLDKIWDKLDAGIGTQGGPPVTGADAPPADMAEQMRQAVRDVNAEAAAAAKTTPDKPDPEQQPREVMVRGKDRLQRALFGQDPKKP